MTSSSDQAAWLGNVLEDHHDASGLLYRRNRYYNPQTGRFTQEDPIGLAGGVNVYGFANGDPASNSDPFGLYVVCRGHACGTWFRLFTEARNASQSGDPAIRHAGRQLLTIMSALVLRTDRQYSLHERANPAWLHARAWAGTARINLAGHCSYEDNWCGPGDNAVVHIEHRNMKRIDSRVRMMHEIGHVYVHEFEGVPWSANSQRRAIEIENLYRTIRGCNFRVVADREETGGPPCRW